MDLLETNIVFFSAAILAGILLIFILTKITDCKILDCKISTSGGGPAPIITFQETWNSATPGDYYTGGITGSDKTWGVIGSSGVRYVTIASQYARIYNNAGASGTQLNCSSLGTTLADTDVVIRMKVSGPARVATIYMYDAAINDIPIYATVALNTGVLTLNGTGYGVVCPLDTWFDLKFRINYSTQRVSCWVDSSSIATDVVWSATATGDLSTSISFRLLNGSSSDYFYVDDVEIGQGMI